MKTKEQILQEQMYKYGIKSALTFTKEAILGAMEEYAKGKFELLMACRDFVAKVDRGEARSKHSYEQMKKAIEKATS